MIRRRRRRQQRNTNSRAGREAEKRDAHRQQWLCQRVPLAKTPEVARDAKLDREEKS